MRTAVFLLDQHMDTADFLHWMGLCSNRLSFLLPGLPEQSAYSYGHWLLDIDLDGTMGNCTKCDSLSTAYGDAMDLFLVSSVRANSGYLPDVSRLWLLPLY